MNCLTRSAYNRMIGAEIQRDLENSRLYQSTEIVDKSDQIG